MIVVLADDDMDDRNLFQQAIGEIDPQVSVTTVPDGGALMQMLTDIPALPGIIFLDINMPQKNGLECLQELRGSGKFNNVLLVIYSTSDNKQHIEETYNSGATLYIKKPSNFGEIKRLLGKTLALETDKYLPQPDKSKFVMQ